jgi:hypothetical protein
MIRSLHQMKLRPGRQRGGEQRVESIITTEGRAGRALP